MQSTNPVFTEGDIVLGALPQSNGQYKLRPVLLLRQLPGYGDFLTCGFSSQIHQLIPGFGELLNPSPDNGLRVQSVIRLEYLTLLPSGRVQGHLGSIPDALHQTLLQRLADYLITP